MYKRIMFAAVAFITIALMLLGALAMLVVPTHAARNAARPMATVAQAPPPPDLGAGDGYMYDATRWVAYNVVGDDVLICSTRGEVKCVLLPRGSVFLVARADSL